MSSGSFDWTPDGAPIVSISMKSSFAGNFGYLGDRVVTFVFDTGSLRSVTVHCEPGRGVTYADLENLRLRTLELAARQIVRQFGDATRALASGAPS